MFGAQSNTFHRFCNKNNSDMDRKDRKKENFQVFCEPEKNPSLNLPSLKVLEDLGLMDRNIVNEIAVARRLGNDIFLDTTS